MILDFFLIRLNIYFLEFDEFSVYKSSRVTVGQLERVCGTREPQNIDEQLELEAR